MRTQRRTAHALVLGIVLGAGAVAARADEPGDWLELTAPRSFEVWRPPHAPWAFVAEVAPRADDPRRLSGQGDGPILYNGPAGRAPNLVTRRDFADVALHAEFLIPRGSNSGIKLQGVYEIQIADSAGKPRATASDCGGIYHRAELFPSYHHIDEGYPPRTNAARPAGEWQTLDLVFRAPRFDADGRKVANARFERVVLNGETIHEQVELPFPTGHAWRRPEHPGGPILLQGDHGPVAFRNLRVRPLEPEGSSGSTPSQINRQFADPSLDVDAFVKRFESAEREVYAHRDAILKAVGLERGQDVADIGAGTGLYTLPFAEAVGPDGTVFAIDISPAFLGHIADVAKRRRLTNVATVLGSARSINLGAGSIDVAFVCDTYHHFEDPEALLATIHRALRPGGRLVVVEFDRRDDSPEFVRNHVRASQAEFVREIEAAGFLRLDVPGAPRLKDNFLAAFRKVESHPRTSGRP
jgi:ubiquinone/menaquinone biosynthesis C-methylase UbiE